MTRRKKPAPAKANNPGDPATWTKAYREKRARMKDPYAPEKRRRRRAQREIESALWALPLWQLSESDVFGARPKKGRTENQLRLEADRRRRRAAAHYKGYIPLLAERYISMALDKTPTPAPPARNVIETEIKGAKAPLTAALRYLAGVHPLTRDALDVAIKKGPHPPAKTLAIEREVMRFERPPRSTGEIMVGLETAIAAIDLAKVPAAAKDTQGRDLKTDALEIAKAAASDFHSLTGQAPTPSEGDGNFLRFLRAVFSALGRHDSADTQGRKACRWWKEDRPSEDQAFLEHLRATKPPDHIVDFRDKRWWWPALTEE